MREFYRTSGALKQNVGNEAVLHEPCVGSSGCPVWLSDDLPRRRLFFDDFRGGKRCRSETLAALETKNTSSVFVVGGFKHFLFKTLRGEIQFDIFFKTGWNHQPCWTTRNLRNKNHWNKGTTNNARRCLFFCSCLLVWYFPKTRKTRDKKVCAYLKHPWNGIMIQKRFVMVWLYFDVEIPCKEICVVFLGRRFAVRRGWT